MHDGKSHRTVLGRFRYVRSADEARRILLQEWGEVRVPKYLAALAATKNSLNGTYPPSHARRAFIAAAIEARILADDVITPVADRRLTFAFRPAAE